MMIKRLLADALIAALHQARQTGRLTFEAIPEFNIDRPANPAFGDFSINLAMIIASQAQLPPRQVAQAMIDHLDFPPHLLGHVEVAGPGFINFYLKPAWLHDAVREIHRQGEMFGRVEQTSGHRVLAEYVSANPNGPLNVLHGRGAVIGDVLCNLMQAAGFSVTREYYINDAATSSQLRRLGECLIVRYLQVFGQDVDYPEDGCPGEYIDQIAQQIKEKYGDRYLTLADDERMQSFTRMGGEAMLDSHRKVLASLGISFDNWFSEKTLLDGATVDAMLNELTSHGATSRAEGALWLTSTRYGDDRDRPLIRSNGIPTYLATDIAYHRNKFDRGYDSLVDIWGADHQGYVARTKAAMAALGYAPERLRILIYQLVTLLRDGEYVSGGRNRADSMLLSELIEQVGQDAVRFFFLLKNADEDLEFDLDLAVRASADNPVYFVRHAHARLCEILRTAAERDITIPDPQSVDLSSLLGEPEIALIRRLTDFPREIAVAAEHCEPHRLARYALELAREFHQFYECCPVLKRGTLPDTRDARLTLLGAVQITLRNSLMLLGISAPEVL